MTEITDADLRARLAPHAEGPAPLDWDDVVWRLVRALEREVRVLAPTVTDSLTGLANRRSLDRALDRELERHRRSGAPIGLVLIDIDDFRSVNDSYGHAQGDEVLNGVASVLRESTRDIDEPARWGGEEFAVVLPQTDLERAAELAERIRAAIARLRVPRLRGGKDLRVTASLGVASVPECASDGDSLLDAAHKALLRAKRAGKNRRDR